MCEKERVQLEFIDIIRAGSKEKDWRGAAWLLERVYRDHFSPPPREPAVAIQNNVLRISAEQRKEDEETRSKLLPEIRKRLGLPTEPQSQPETPPVGLELHKNGAAAESERYL